MIVPPSRRHLVVATLLLFQLCSCETVISAVETTHAASSSAADDVIDTSAEKTTTTSVDDAKNATESGGDDGAEDNKDNVCTSGAGGQDEDGTCQASTDSTSSTTPKCGVYLALSTLPGTGIGMFAGRDYKEGQDMMELGDHVIPIVDVNLHQRKGMWFLWDDYTWDSDTVRATYEGVNEVNAASPGFGAAANSYMDFLNVDEGLTQISVPNNLHRSKDPGVGGFTYFHSRKIEASKNITQGQELFVSYGNHWYVIYTCSDGFTLLAIALHERRLRATFSVLSNCAPSYLSLRSIV